MKSSSGWHDVRTIFRFMGRKKPLFVAAIMLAVAGGVAAGPILARSLVILVQSVVDRDLTLAAQSTALLVATAAFTGLSFGLSEYLTSIVTEATALGMREGVMRSGLRAKLSYWTTHKVGDSVSVMVNDVETAKQGIRLIQEMAGDLSVSVSSVVLIALWAPQVLVTILVMGVLCAYVGGKIAVPVRKTSDQYQKGLEENTAAATEALGGLAVVKSLGAEEATLLRLRRMVSSLYTIGARRGALIGLQWGVSGITQILTWVALMIVSGTMVMTGRIGAPTAIGLVQLAGTPVSVLANLASSWTALQQNLSGAKRVALAIDTPPQEAEVTEAPLCPEAPVGTEALVGTEYPRGAGVLGDSEVLLEFQEVSFGYNGEKQVLGGASFSIAEGERTAVIGPSGSGKTSILRLIQRFYEPSEGHIRLWGRDIATIPLRQLREQVGFVPQEPAILPGSVTENITFGVDDASLEQVVFAAKMANAHEFVSKLPDGYDTILDERGGNLSGGEKQRICLARAFFKGARILLLDEPTSSVDSLSEALIQESIDAYAKGATVITVSHHKNMAAGADVVLRVRDGEVSVSRSLEAVASTDPAD